MEDRLSWKDLVQKKDNPLNNNLLPNVAIKTEKFLNIEPLKWEDTNTTLLNHQINKFEPLMMRVEKEKVEAMIENSKKNLTKI